MLNKNRHGNPVWSKSDQVIRRFLESDMTPKTERDALLQEQIRILKTLKTAENPSWQEVQHKPVETQCIRDVLCLDGLVRRNRMA